MDIIGFRVPYRKFRGFSLFHVSPASKTHVSVRRATATNPAAGDIQFYSMKCPNELFK